MKLQIKSLLLAATLAPASLLAQGTLNFQNIVPVPGINAPVFDSDGKTLLSGPGFLAQLFAGPDSTSLAPVGATAIFRTGAGAGFWDPSPSAVRSIPTVAPGAKAAVQVRVWESAKGATFDKAVAAGSKVGSSLVLTIALGGSGSPPSLPANLIGLKSFSLETAKEPPLIVRQPTGHVVREGKSVSLEVAARSTSPLTYQWQKQATTNSFTNIVGATNAVLEIKTAQKSDTGAYRVLVSNANASVTSDVAQLRVISPPGFAKKRLRRHPDGKFELGLEGDANVTYRIEASTNLVDWTVIATIKSEHAEEAFVDGEAAMHRHRFYRVTEVDQVLARAKHAGDDDSGD